MKVKSESEVAQSCPTLSDPMDCSLPGSSVQGFSRQEYWSGVPLPSPITIVNTVLFVLNSFFNLFGRFDPRGPPAFKMEMKQQEPQEEEIPVWDVSTLKISRNHCPQRHHPYDLPTWGQIKTPTNRAENLVSQQGMPRSPEYILLAMLSLLACISPCSSSDSSSLHTQPRLLQVIEWT